MAIDTATIRRVRERLYSAVISDVLDTLGNWDHALAPHVRPLDEKLILFGGHGPVST